MEGRPLSHRKPFCRIYSAAVKELEHYERSAREALAEGRLLDAALAATRLVERAPEAAHARRLLAEILLRVGLDERAEEQAKYARLLEAGERLPF